MAAFSWRRWLGSLFSVRAKKTKSRQTRRLQVEHLESRLAPATFIWTGGAGANNTLWSTGANWQGGTAPTGSVATLADLVFPAGPTVLNTTDNLVNLGNAQPTFNSITFSGSGYTLALGSGQGITGITLGSATASGSGFITVGNNISDTINLPITLGDASGALQFMTVNSGATLTINGQISGSTGATLTKAGGGTLDLTGDNVGLSGPVNVSAAGGILEIQNAQALGSGSNTTTVEDNSTLAVDSVIGNITENLILNGLGANGNLGALDNLAGTNTWAGKITLDSDSSVGAAAGALNITGVIGDLGGGFDISKVGVGTVAFDAANTYRGITFVDNGILRIGASQALGLGDGTTGTGTVVNTNPIESGTLQLDVTTGAGFTVPDESLTLNGVGFQGLGALDNLNGNNTWAGPVVLGNQSPEGSPSPGQGTLGPDIAVESQNGVMTQLTISGVVSDGVAGAQLNKSSTGELILTNANTYTGGFDFTDGNGIQGTSDVDDGTNVLQGVLDIANSLALGPNVNSVGTIVFSGAALWLDVDGAVDPVTQSTNSLNVSQNIAIMGTGINNTGALLSHSGINIWNGTIDLVNTAPYTATTDAIGVDPDPNASASAAYFTNDYSLTITQAIYGDAEGGYAFGGAFGGTYVVPAGALLGVYQGNPYATLEKVDGGNLILPFANTYLGPTIVAGGWVTAQNDFSLGVQTTVQQVADPNTITQIPIVNPGQTEEPTVTVLTGASVQLRPLVPGTSLTIFNDFVLAGSGVTDPYLSLDQQGALLNLSGNNIIEGNIALDGSVGIGVQSIVPNETSELILVGTQSDGSIPGGLVKLGTERLDIQGPGTFTGNVEIRQGVIEVQNTTGLGAPNGGTVTVDGPNALTPTVGAAALEIANSAPTTYGGLTTGIEIWDRDLILNGPGYTVDGISDSPLVNEPGYDNAWEGPVTLNTNVTIDTQPNSRLILLGNIGDATNTSANGSSLTKVDTGELLLAGNNSYRGTTFINAGIVDVENSSALGAVSGVVNVAAAAQLQIVSGVSIAGKQIVVQGTGVPTAPTTSPTWFPVGTAPLTNQDINNDANDVQNTSGRVTGVAVDPSDPNTIYISTAGGGAWKTVNGGQTWTPLLLNAGVMYAGAIAVDPNDPRVIYLGTGDGEGPGDDEATSAGFFAYDSYAGSGLYKSTDSGQTWTLVTGTSSNGVTNPFAGTAITSIAIDPSDPESLAPTPTTPANPVIYVANSDLAANATPTLGDVGIWRYSPDPPNELGTQEPNWFNLTAVVSTNRNSATAPTADVADAPNNPGPDDNFDIAFPQEDATWSSLYIGQGSVNGQPVGTVLYAALGSYDGDFPELPGNKYVLAQPITPGSVFDDGVYRLPLWQEFYTLTNNGVPQESPPLYSTNAAKGYPNPNPDYTVEYGYVNTVWFFGNGFIDNDPLNAAATAANTNYGIVQAVNSGTTVFPSPLGGQMWDNGTISLSGNGTTVYAAVAHDAYYGDVLAGNTFTDESLYSIEVTTNGGFSWTAMTPTTPGAAGSDDSYMGDNGDYANAIAVSPTNAQEVFVGGEDDILESTNGGAAWTSIYFAPAVGTAAPQPVADAPELNVHSMEVDSNGNLVIGSDGGVWIYNTKTDLWSDYNGDLDTQLVTSVSVDETQLGVTVAATANNGFGSTTGSQAFGWGEGSYGGSVAINPTNGDIVYGGTATGLGGGVLYESTSGGALGSWVPILQNTNDTVFPFVLDSVNNSRLLVGGVSEWEIIVPTNTSIFNTIQWVSGAVLQESLDGGSSFTNIGRLNQTTYNGGGNTLEQFMLTEEGFDLDLAPGSITPPGTYFFDIGITDVASSEYQGTFVADPNFPDQIQSGPNTYDPNTIYVTDGFNLFVTKDHGTNWVLYTPPVSNEGFIQDIYVDPQNENTVYVLYSSPGGDEIMKSVDGGQTWNPIVYNLPDEAVWTITSDPRSGALYIGTDTGVMALPSGSTTWVPFGSGMPNVQVDSLVVNQNLNTLTAGTYGLGVYTLYLEDVQANSGALRAVSGQSVWTGPVELQANTIISAEGTQTALQDGISTAQITILGTISDGTPNADYTLTKTGDGNVVFAGDNTYGGVTIVEEGALIVDNPSALGATGPGQGTIVEAGAALELESDLDGEAITLNGDGIEYEGHNDGAFENISNDNTYTGELTLDSDSTIGVSSGTTLTIAAPGGITDDSGGFGLTKELGGTLFLTTADTYHGYTDVNQGILNISNGAALGAYGAETTVLDGAQLQLQGAVGIGIDVADEILRISGSGNGGTGALENVSGPNTWAGPVILAQDPAFSPASTPATSVSIGSLNQNVGDELTIDGGISEAMALTGLVKVGLGLVILDDNNSYSGGTLISAGSLEIEQSGALGATGTGTVVASGGQLEINGGVTGFTVSGEKLTLNGNGVSPANAGSVDNIAGSNVWSGAVILQTNASLGSEAFSQLTVTGIVQDPSPLLNTAATLTKVGPGIIEFASANTYGGQTVVADGALQIGSATGLGITSPEIQTITVIATGSSGTFSLTYGGVTTTPLSYTGSTPTPALTVQTALQSLLPVGATVSVTLASNVYTVTFGGTLLGQALQKMTSTVTGGVTAATVAVVANGAGGTVVEAGGSLQLTGGIDVSTYNLTLNGAGTLFTSPEIQTVTVNAPGATGSFTLTYGSKTTTAITYTNSTAATAATVQAALDAILPTGGTATVTLAGNVYTVTFGGTLLGENLAQMSGQGTNGVTAVVATLSNGASTTDGALDSASGDNTWSVNNIWVTDIVLGSNASIGAFGSSLLTITSPVTDNGQKFSLSQYGPGTVQFNSATANTYSGITDVVDGTMELNDIGGVLPVVGNLEIGNGPATVNGSPNPDSAEVELLTGSEIATTATVTVNGDGTFDLNGFTQSVAGLALTGGAVSLPGSSELMLLGNVTASQDASGNGASITGTGTLQMDTSTLTFTVTGPGIGAPNPDLIVGSAIVGIGAEGFTKAGGGVMELTADEFNQGPSNIGTINVTGGMLLADGPTSANTIDAVTLNGGGIGGKGIVGTVTSNSGTVAPGNTDTDLGNLTSGNETWNSSTNFDVALKDTGAGDFDTLTVDGNLAINGATLGGFTGLGVNDGDSFTIITTTGTLSGTFAQPFGAGVAFIGGVLYSVTYNAQSVVVTRGVETTTTKMVSSANPAVYGQDVRFTATVTPQPGGGPIPTSDTVTFTLDGTITDQVDLQANGTAVFDPLLFTGNFLAIGGHTITATFNGDTDYMTSTAATIDQTVNQASTTVTLSSGNANTVYGQSVTMTATVAPLSPAGGIPTGSVIFTVNGIAEPAILLNGAGTASIILNGLIGSGQTVTAAYSGDTNYKPSSTSGPFIINVVKDTPVLMLNALPTTTEYSQIATFAVVISANPPGTAIPSGTVSFYNGSTFLGTQTLDAGGTAEFQTTALAAGLHTITVTYAGDQHVLSGSTTLSYNVTNEITVTTLSLSASSIVFGQSVTLSAHVTGPSPATVGVPPGTVQFVINGVQQTPVQLDANGNASIIRSNFNIGANSVTVDYQGFTNFAPSNSNTLTVTTLAGDAVKVTSSAPSGAAYYSPVIFTATVTPQAPGTVIPTGTVTFVLTGATTYTSAAVALNSLGSATFTASPATANQLNAGTTSVTVHYSGDSNYIATASTAIKQSVTQAPTKIALGALSPLGTTVYGQSRTITATVTTTTDGGAIMPDGAVTFNMVNTATNTVTISYSVPVSGGQAPLTFGTVPTGSYKITATYTSNGYSGNFAASSATGTAPTFSVIKASTTATLSTPGSSTVYGQPLSFTTTVNELAPSTLSPGSTVTYYIDGKAQNPIALTGGQAVFSSSTIAAGSHTVRAVYNGGGNYNASDTATDSFVVNKASTGTALTVSPSSPVYGQSVTLTATVTGLSPSTIVPVGTVTFVVDGVNQTAITINGAGVATLALKNLNAGFHTFDAVFNGNTNFGSSDAGAQSLTIGQANTATALTASSSTSGVGQPVTFTATVTPVSPSTVTPVGSVTFLVNGSSVQTVAINSAGKATLTLTNLPFGAPTVQADYNGNTNFAASQSNTLTHNVVLGSTTTVAASGPTSFGQSVTFTATVSGAGATPTGSVTFIIDGVNDGSVPLSGGLASIGLNTLGAGTHTIVATYSGDSNYGASSNSPALSYTVSKAGTSTAIATSSSTSYSGQAVTFTATVTGVAGAKNPTGSVTFYVNGVAKATEAISGTQAAFVDSSLTAGSYTIKAVYNGDGNYASGSTASLTQTVINPPPPTSLTATPNAPNGTNAGTAFSISVDALLGSSLDSNYNGSVTISIFSGPSGGGLSGSLTIQFVNGVATFNLSFTKNGSYVLKIATGGISTTLAITTGNGRQGG